MIALHNSTWQLLVTERKLPCSQSEASVEDQSEASKWCRGSETGIDDVQLEGPLYEVLPGDPSPTLSDVSAAIITSVHNLPGPEFNLHENWPIRGRGAW